MSSRSKKIMELINSTTYPSRDDTEAQIQDPILNPDLSQSPIQYNTSDSNKVVFDIDKDSSVQNVAVDVAEDWGYNFNKTEDKNILSWNDIKVIKVIKSEPFSFYVKTSYNKDAEFEKINVRNKRKKLNPISELTTVKAYTGKQKLGENKKKDLKELLDKNLIPNFYKDFYDTIL
ncbi:unnamed protein product [Euphydryas editha]|uniref:Uncharacterized protein n=1 Tax=Euphydryas editha TaxID=104508 RepID=A0AAU9UGC2_EUPED|nr:unnamed protein product [Euphydryas editha]CAH2098081.1 unnamed protein product [Euphydryas editha]